MFQLFDLLTKNKEACEYFARIEKERLFIVLLQKWMILCDLMDVLKVPFEFTSFLQSPNLTLSDMYGKWLKMERVGLDRLKKENTGSKSKFATLLSNTLENRKPMVLNTPLVLSAVYLDPRFRCFLNNNQIKIAKETLFKWHNKIYSLEPNHPETNTGKEKDSFEEVFRAMEMDETIENVFRGDFTTNSPLDRVQFSLLLNEYEKNHPRIHYKQNIHEYWNKYQQEFSLFKLARFIHSIPPTQVDIEKGFSVVGFVLSPLRLSLKPKSLDEIIMIKLNEDLWHKINAEVVKNLFQPDAIKF